MTAARETAIGQLAAASDCGSGAPGSGDALSASPMRPASGRRSSVRLRRSALLWRDRYTWTRWRFAVLVAADREARCPSSRHGAPACGPPSIRQSTGRGLAGPREERRAHAAPVDRSPAALRQPLAARRRAGNLPRRSRAVEPGGSFEDEAECLLTRSPLTDDMPCGEPSGRSLAAVTRMPCMPNSGLCLKAHAFERSCPARSVRKPS
jgi:hypothetical protein